jgi:hypothetical protein
MEQGEFSVIINLINDFFIAIIDVKSSNAKGKHHSIT